MEFAYRYENTGDVIFSAGVTGYDGGAKFVALLPRRSLPKPVDDNLAEGLKFSGCGLSVPFPQQFVQVCRRPLPSSQGLLKSGEHSFSVISQESHVQVQHLIEFAIERRII